MDEIVAIFADMGFAVAEGPDIEDDWHNFTALNIPPDHPARQMHDTFYLPPSGDGRAAGAAHPHLAGADPHHAGAASRRSAIIAPGRTYRRDNDATHTPMFHQVEGLVIDRDTHMGHLKGCLIDFVPRLSSSVDDVPVRFRPSYFPFTEPSAEVDIGCRRTGGELKIGEGGDWLEILGCGMVHPKRAAATAASIPSEWQGFAFGMGIDRIAMLKYGIPDLRTFFESDLRWLRHYGFAAARRAHHLRAGCRDEVHPLLAEGASRDRRVARRRSATRLTMLGLEVEGVDRPGRRRSRAFSVGLRASRRSSTRTPTGCASARSRPATACSRSSAARPTRAPA